MPKDRTRAAGADAALKARPGAAEAADGAGGSQAQTIALLSDPATYADRPPSVDVRETHGALVFLAGERAYKMKRAVRYSYLDFSTLALRRRVIERELAINRPHAPGLYLGVVAVTREPGGGLAIGGSGEPVEWLLAMRRFDERDLLAALASAAPLGARLCRELADAAHAFHARAPVARNADSTRQMRAIVDEVADAIAEAAPGGMSGDLGRLRLEAQAHIGRVSGLLERRAAAGFVRRCHGDLHLGNIVLIEGAPVLFDAIEFDDALATVDTLYDLAFLLMDLDHRGQRAGANAVLGRYLWRSQQPLDLEGLAALPLFLSLRAAVRAMVSAQRAAPKAGAAREEGLAEGGSYLTAALRHLAPAPLRLVAIGGLSGTGKSTLAAALAPRIGRCPGAVHLRTDLERKALFGANDTERLPESAYTPEATARVYAAVMEKARLAAEAGHSVVADGVFATSAERAAIAEVAGCAGAAFTGLWLEASRGVLLSRVEARTGDASDATSAVVERQLGYDIGGMTWATIEAGGSADRTLEAALARLREDGAIP